MRVLGVRERHEKSESATRVECNHVHVHAGMGVRMLVDGYVEMRAWNMPRRYASHEVKRHRVAVCGDVKD